MPSIEVPIMTTMLTRLCERQPETCASGSHRTTAMQIMSVGSASSYPLALTCQASIFQAEKSRPSGHLKPKYRFHTLQSRLLCPRFAYSISASCIPTRSSSVGFFDSGSGPLLPAPWFCLPHSQVCGLRSTVVHLLRASMPFGRRLFQHRTVCSSALGNSKHPRFSLNPMASATASQEYGAIEVAKRFQMVFRFQFSRLPWEHQELPAY